jgi:hypothetical protein
MCDSCMLIRTCVVLTVRLSKRKSSRCISKPSDRVGLHAGLDASVQAPRDGGGCLVLGMAADASSMYIVSMS